MPEHLRALVAILALALAVFFVIRRPACATAISCADFDRRRNLWLTITLIAFVSHNFWVCIAVTAIVLAYMAPRDSNRIALYLYVLLALPQIGVAISGFGIINQLFVIDYTRLLAMVLLAPVALSLRIEELKRGEQLTLPDKLLLAYVVLSLALQFLAISLTGSMRNALYAFIDILLPYYVVSRSLQSVERLRDAIMSFVVAAALMSAIGIFEFSRHWLLYSSLDSALGVEWAYGGYLERDDLLRVMATSGQPIVFGYVMAVAFGLLLYAKELLPGALSIVAGQAVLLAGLVVSVSRGPWIGALAIVITYIATGKRAFAKLGQLFAAGLLLVPLMYFTPSWDRIVGLLPFIGETDIGSVTYRERLLELSIQIILENPFFGSADFLLFLEEMRQGEGIIDIVNTYLMIALRSGLIGLALFLGFFGVIMVAIARRMRLHPADSEAHRLGQALLAVLAGILVMIFTVSSINQVPVIYWAVAGLGYAYSRHGVPASRTTILGYPSQKLPTTVVANA